MERILTLNTLIDQILGWVELEKNFCSKEIGGYQVEVRDHSIFKEQLWSHKLDTFSENKAL